MWSVVKLKLLHIGKVLRRFGTIISVVVVSGLLLNVAVQVRTLQTLQKDTQTKVQHLEDVVIASRTKDTSPILSDQTKALIEEAIAKHLRSSESTKPTALGVTTETIAPSAPIPTFVRIKASAVGLIYSAPSVSSGVVATASAGMIFPYKDKESGWYHIQVLDGENGYILGEEVEELL